MSLIEVTDETFEQEINSDVIVVVKFGAPWCGPCSAFQPVVEELASEYVDKAKFMKVDTDSTTVASKFNIRGIPTILIFKNGQVVQTIVGAQSKGRLQLAIDTLLV